MAYSRRRDFDSAIRDLSEAIRINPDWSFYYDRGTICLEKQIATRTIRDFTTVIDLFPDYGPAYKMRSRAYETKRDYDKAKADDALSKTQFIQKPLNY